MKITSAKFSNAENTAVVLSTIDSGLILLFLNQENSSEDARNAYDVWIESGGNVEAYEPPMPPRQLIDDFISMNGYTVLSLLNLKDIEDKLCAANVELPTKSAAVRSWISSVQVAYAQGSAPPSAPHSYKEILAELLPYLDS